MFSDGGGSDCSGNLFLVASGGGGDGFRVLDPLQELSVGWKAKTKLDGHPTNLLHIAWNGRASDSTGSPGPVRPAQPGARPATAERLAPRRAA